MRSHTMYLTGAVRNGKRTCYMFCLVLLMLLLLTPSPLVAQDSSETYADPDGLFSVVPPAGYPEPELIRYADITSKELPGLLNDHGYLFVDQEDGGYAFGILFLLLEEDIVETADWLAFTDSFLASVFEELEVLDSALGGVQDFVRSVEGFSRGDHILIGLEERDGVVMASIGSVDDDTWLDRGVELQDAVGSVEWSPEAAIAFLDGEAAEVAPEESTRFEDDLGVFSILLPEGYALDEVDRDDGYGLSFSGPAGDRSLLMGVLPARGMLGEETEDAGEAGPLTDDEWDEFVTEFVAQATEDVEATTLDQGVVEHVLYLVAEDEESQEGAIMLWLEEAEGLVTILAVIREEDLGDNNMSEDQFGDLVTSFAWSPQLAKRAINENVDAEDGVQDAMFVDPFGVVSLLYPASMPLDGAELTDEGLFYGFLSEEGLDALFIAIDDIGASLDVDEWAQVVDESAPSLSPLVQISADSVEPTLVDVFVSDSANYAALEFEGDLYYGLFELQEVNGALATTMLLIDVEEWESRESAARELLFGIEWDADQALAVIEEARASDVRFVEGEFDSSSATYPLDEVVTFTSRFDNERLAGPLSLYLHSEDGRTLSWYDQPGSLRADGDAGLDVDFVFAPPQPWPTATSYLADLTHDGRLLGSYRFSLADSTLFESQLNDARLSIDNGVETDIFYPNESVLVRGSGDFLAGDQLRALWYDEFGPYLAATQTRHFAQDQANAGFQFGLAPVSEWSPGFYSVLLTLNGDSIWEGTYEVVEGSDEFAEMLNGPPIDMDNIAQLESVLESPVGLDPVHSAAVSSDGRWLAVGSSAGGLQLYAANMLEPIVWDGLSSQGVSALAFSPDSQLLAIAAFDEGALVGSSVIQVWDMERGNLLANFLGHGDDINGLAFSPDRTLLASSSSDGTIRLWLLNGRAPATILVAPRQGVQADAMLEVAFSPDGSILAVSSETGEVHLWDVAAASLIESLDAVDGAVVSLAFAQETPRLAAGSTSGLSLWDVDVEGAEYVSELSVDSALSLLDLDVTPDGSLLALALQDDEGNGEVHFAQVGEAVEVVQTFDHPGVTSVEFGPGGASLFSLDADTVWLHVIVEPE